MTNAYASSRDALQAQMQDDTQWVHPRKDYANTGYSGLKQIKPSNINKLQLAWTFATGVNRGHEGSPIVLGSIMYVHTAFPNNIYALDLNNDQKIIWSYFPQQNPVAVVVSMACAALLLPITSKMVPWLGKLIVPEQIARR